MVPVHSLQFESNWQRCCKGRLAAVRSFTRLSVSSWSIGPSSQWYDIESTSISSILNFWTVFMKRLYRIILLLLGRNMFSVAIVILRQIFVVAVARPTGEVSTHLACSQHQH